MDFDIKHWSCKPYYICLINVPTLTLSYFMARPNIDSCSFDLFLIFIMHTFIIGENVEF